MQTLGHLVDQARWNQRLVALDIDQYRLAGKSQQFGNFGQAVSPRWMIAAGHDHLGTEWQQGIVNSLIVGSHDHAFSGTLLRALPDMRHHGLTRNVEQRLSRQAGGAIAGRNNRDKPPPLGHPASPLRPGEAGNFSRSEERRVGRECSSWGYPQQL